MVFRAYDYLKKWMHNQHMINQTVTTPRINSVWNFPSVETPRVTINKSDSMLSPAFEKMPISPKVPVSFGSRTLQVSAVSYDDNAETTNNYECMERSSHDETNTKPTVESDRFEVLLKMIENVRKQVDGIETKIRRQSSTNH